MSQPVSRRDVLKGGLAAFAVGAALPTPLAAAPAPLPHATPPPQPLDADSPRRGLAAVTRVLWGVGVYVGNDWFDWDDDARRFAMAKVRGWGFDFLCPKVGGYGRTWYRDEGHLRRWADDARAIGLGFAPFIYSIPETAVPDAKISAQIARVVGIANVDLEDEWGSKRGNPNVSEETTGYKGAEMAEFGRVFRAEAGDLPIIANGYGDPITRFGPAGTGFPNAEMMAWADVYSPQWYIGVWNKYHTGGVQAALDWGRAEVRQALRPDFPLAPSVDLSSLYTPDRLFPLADTLVLMAAMRAYQAPIFVWEYNLMTPLHAEALLGAPQVRNVRVGLARRTSWQVIWETHVPARSVFGGQVPSGARVDNPGTVLKLTHSQTVEKLPPGTALPVSVGAESGGGSAGPVTLTVATSPATPGIYLLAALPERRDDGHWTVALTLAHSAETDLAAVTLTSLTADGGAVVLAPTSFPYDLGPLGAYDWATRTTNRLGFSVVLDRVPASAKTVTLSLSGTADGKAWSTVMPVALG